MCIETQTDIMAMVFLCRKKFDIFEEFPTTVYRTFKGQNRRVVRGLSN